MNYKMIATLIICVFFAVASVSATDKYYESKYKDTNPAIELKSAGQTLSCNLYGSVKAGKGLTTEIHMFRFADNSGKYEVIPVNDDGTFEYSGLANGTYVLKPYPFGNGMQEEISYVTCNAGAGKVYPEKEILGAAITVEGKTVKVKPTVTVTPTITPRCHYHDGYWKQVCIPKPHGHGQICTWIYVPGYWCCSNHHDCDEN